MKRIAIIEGSYVRDTQVFTEDPRIIEENSDWEDHFADIKYPCQYVGVFEGSDENTIRNRAAFTAGVHPDAISLVDFEVTE